MPKPANEPLRICHFNAQSVENKLDELKHFLVSSKIHICSVNETWLNPNKSLKIKDFDVIRRDRPSQGGGVCLIVHNTLKYDTLSLISPDEILAINVKSVTADSKDLTVISYYKPPKDNFNPNPLEQILSTHRNVLLIGDLNAHHASWYGSHSCVDGEAIVSFINEHDLCILNNDSPTYQPLHRSNYQSILDLAICSRSLINSFLHFETTDEIRSDHLPIIVEFKSNLSLSRSSPTKNINLTDWKKFGELATKEAHNLEVESLNSTSDIDLAISKLTQAIQTSSLKSTKSKAIPINNHQFLVLPKSIVDLIQKKRKALRRFHKTHQQEDKTEYSRLQSLVRSKIREHKQACWRSTCSELNVYRTSDTLLWRKLNSLSGTKPPRPKQIKLKNEAGVILDDPVVVAKTFAEFLGNIFKDNDDAEFDANFKLKVLRDRTSFFSGADNAPMLPTTPEEVQSTIKNELRGKGAPGADNITNKTLKRLPPIYFSLLASIFNACLRLSYMPDQWKLAVIIMLLKSDKDSLLVASYRPISLLITLSKLFERIVLARVDVWLSSENILSRYQAGFRKHKQTRDHMFRLIQFIQAAFNRGYQVGSVFIDIEKAFDKVWHAGLLFKLDRLGIPHYLGRWIANYLDGRTFSVRCNGTLSEPYPILAGVPQGSVLGPILFNIFFNDIAETIHGIQLALFADDVAAWTRGIKLSQIENRLQVQLNKIENWMSKWRTKLSTSKTTFLIFNKNGRFDPNSIKLTYCNTRIKAEKYPKFLGLTLDPGLRLKEHANRIHARALRRINFLRRIKGQKWGASSKLILTTYKALIRPIIDYAPFATLTMDAKYQLKLERLQRAAIRVAIPWYPHTSASQIYNRIKMEPIVDRAKRLSKNYLSRTLVNGSIANEAIEEYYRNGVRDDGPYWKNSNRPTLLGHILPEYACRKSKSDSTLQPTQCAINA